MWDLVTIVHFYLIGWQSNILNSNLSQKWPSPVGATYDTIMAPKPRPKSFEHFLKDLFHGSLSICNAQKQIQREYTTYFHKGSTNDSCLIIMSSIVEPKLSGFNFISISRIGQNDLICCNFSFNKQTLNCLINKVDFLLIRVSHFLVAGFWSSW